MSSKTFSQFLKTSLHIVCKFAMDICKILCIATSAISSAYPIIKNLKGKFELISCSAKIFQRNGEIIPPCGQPMEII